MASERSTEVIPAINCEDFACVDDRVARAESFLPASGWVHIDVTDGKFTFNKTWNSPEEFRTLRARYPRLQFEIHLMVEEPHLAVPLWLDAGASRVIVHLEAILHYRSIEDYDKAIDAILASCREHGAKAMLALAIETPVEEALPYGTKFSSYQILAVQPGLAGQKFFPTALEKIKLLRQYIPNATIEVDGGINEQTAKLAKDAGADIIVAASYIFGADDPKSAYEALKQIGTNT